MRNYYFLLFLFMFENMISCSPLPSMLDAIRHKCSLHKSQQNKFEILPELQECQNWTMIISTKEFSDINKNEIECLLLFDSLVSMCTEGELEDKFFQLLKPEPDVMSARDVCKYLLNLPLASSPTIHNIIKTQEVCEHMCGIYQNDSIVSNTMCAKSYLFYKFSTNVHMSHNNDSNAQNTLKDPPNHIEATSEIRIVKNDNTENLGPEVEETHTEKEGTENVNQANPQDVIGSQEPLSEPVVGPFLKGGNVSVTSLNSSTVAISQLNQTQAIKDRIQKTDTGTNNLYSSLNGQQVPPMTTNLNDQNTAQGQMYDADEEISYNTEQGKDQRVVKPEVLPEDGKDDDDEDDDEEVVNNKSKAPEVSQLSDRFEYDGDLSGNSYFFSYFSFTCIVLVLGYVLYHNKQKVIALLVEGRHSRRPQRARRPNSANYHKLDSNLEEAISSSVSKNPSHVIY